MFYHGASEWMIFILIGVVIVDRMLDVPTIVVGHRFHVQNRLSEAKTNSIIEVTSVLGVI